ncbi:MAG TPA: hypothetical protein VF746_18995 [Longimicrobium sp.]|jgi:hypothetical protein
MAAELIAKVYSAGFLVIGLSHLARPRLWADFFAEVLRSRHAAFLIGTLTLPAGLLIVVGHNVWVPGPRTLITLAGWGMTLKATAYLLFPRSADRLVATGATPRSYAIGGAVMSAIGALLVFDVFLS